MVLERKARFCRTFQKKKNKCVLLLSTHRDGKLLDAPNCLPERIDFYTTDQLGSTYNVARNCNRWPLVIFYSLLNVAAINARIVLLYTQNPPLKYKKRSLFIKDLAFRLIAPHMKKRGKIKTLPNNIKISCQKFTNQLCSKQNEPENISPPAKRPKQVVVRYAVTKRTEK